MKFLNKIKLLFSTMFLVRRDIFHFVQKEVVGQEFDCVVDIGAGKAPFRKLIKAKKYIGIDIEDRGFGDGLIIADINECVPLKDQSVDLVLMTEVLEHIKEPKAVLAEVYRILKPGGKLILTTPFVWPEHEAPNDFYRYTKYGLEYLLREAGFVNIDIKPSSGYGRTLLQLFCAPLRRKIFTPLVLASNLLGLLIFSSGDESFPLVYLVSARRDK